MSLEGIGIVCQSCKHFNQAFTMERPETVLEWQTEGKNHDLPQTCAECGESITDGDLEPESQRRRVARETRQDKQRVLRRSWNGPR